MFVMKALRNKRATISHIYCCTQCGTAIGFKNIVDIRCPKCYAYQANYLLLEEHLRYRIEYYEGGTLLDATA
jgi:rubrerythrin